MGATPCGQAPKSAAKLFLEEWRLSLQQQIYVCGFGMKCSTITFRNSVGVSAYFWPCRVEERNIPESNKTYEKSKCSWRLESLERLVWAQYVCVTPTDQAAPVWMCLMSPRASCVPPTGSPLSQQPRRVCSTYAAGSLRLGGVWYPWCWKPTLDLHGKTTSPVGVRCVVVGGVMTRGWGGLVYQMNMCQEAHTQTDRQKPTRFFLLLPSLISSVLFFFQPLRCFVVQSQRWDSRRHALLFVCL